MAKKRRFLGSHFNFSRWMGLSEIKGNARSIKSLFNSLGDFDSSGEKETFAESVSRLGLTEDDITKRTMYFLKLAIVYLFCAICMLGYSIYLYSEGDFVGAFMCLPILMVILSFCFKEHFWYTQMKHRRLGLSARDWFYSLVKGEPKA